MKIAITLKVNILSLEKDSYNLAVENEKQQLQMNELIKYNSSLKDKISFLENCLNKINLDIINIQKRISYKLGLLIAWILRKIINL